MEYWILKECILLVEHKGLILQFQANPNVWCKVKWGEFDEVFLKFVWKSTYS